MFRYFTYIIVVLFLLSACSKSTQSDQAKSDISTQKEATISNVKVESEKPIVIKIVPDPKKKYAKAGTALRAIQDLDDMLKNFKEGATLSKDDRRYNSKLKQQIISGTFDVHELSKLSLSTHWEGRSEKDREKFVHLMSSLLQEKALFSNEQTKEKGHGGEKYNVKYVGESFINEVKDRSLVNTKVLVPSDNVTIGLNYKLKKVTDEWKIFDIIVDEASLVVNYRYRFNSLINEKGYPHLVGLMEKKLESLKNRRQAMALKKQTEKQAKK